MKYLLSLVLLSLPLGVFAQRKRGIKPLPTQISKPQAVDVQQALQGLMNPRGFELAQDAVLYLQLGDTLGPPARQIQPPTRLLHPGDKVILEQQLGTWLKVVLGNANGTGYSENNTPYYLRASDTKGAKVFILL
jgi:hypothetical protein